MKNNNKNKNSGINIGVLDVLQIIFIVLKLTDLIDWSWWIVLAPIWITFCLVLFIIIVETASDE